MARLLSLILIAAIPVLVAAQEPPSIEGQIDPTAFDDGQRSIVLRVPHGAAMLEPASIALVKSRANVRRGDGGDILVEIIDRRGSLMDQWNAPHPHMRNAERLAVEEARYVLPYSKALSSVRITDLQSGQVMEARLDRAIEDFCAAEPADIACDQIDLQADITAVDGSQRSLPVSEFTHVTLRATFRNLQGETDGVSMAIAPFFVSPNLSVQTADPTSFTEGRVDGSYRRVERVTYRIACNAPGPGRIFPQAVIGATGGPAVVDVDPDNNRFNTILDIDCT